MNWTVERPQVPTYEVQCVSRLGGSVQCVMDGFSVLYVAHK